MQHALKVLDASQGRVGGYLVVWGSPRQRDLQGEYFSKATDLGLDWYEQRPVLYHHGLDKTVKTELVGIIDTLKADETGVWAEAQLDMRKRYVSAVMKLVEKGALAWSSGSLPHLVEYDADGHIKRWPIVEGSLTPTPAEPRMTNVNTIKTLYTSLGWDAARLNLDADPPEVDPARSIKSAEPTPESLEELIAKAGLADGEDDPEDAPPAEPPTDSSQSGDRFKMNIKEILMMFVQQLAAAGAQISEEQATAAVANVEQALSANTEDSAEASKLLQAGKFADLATLLKPYIEKEFNATLEAARKKQAEASAAMKSVTDAIIGSGGSSRVGGFRSSEGGGNDGSGGSRHAQISLKSNRYGDMTPEDLSYLHMLMDAASLHSTKRHWRPDDEFVRELVGKTAESYQKGKLSFGDAGETQTAVKSVNMAMSALKANELNHSTLSSFGDEWVPDLWASQIWELFRLEAVIAPLFRIIEMPSNPFEVPLEGSDPTVYFVPETTAEESLTLASSSSIIPDSKIGSGKVQLNAKKLALRVGFSEELNEDSLIPVVSQYRDQAQKAIIYSIDAALLNGDTETSGNVNLDGGTPAATAVYMAFNGLRKAALVTANPVNSVDMNGAAPTLAKIRESRFTMPIARASKPSDIAYITHGEVYAKLLGLNEFLTVDKYGPNATVLSGELGKIDNSPLLLTDQLGLTASNGKISSTGGDNDFGSLVTVHKPSWIVGYRRRVRISVDWLPYYDSYQMSATVRIAFVGRDAEGAAVLYEILV